MNAGFSKGCGFECSLELARRTDIETALAQVEILEIIPESFLFGRQAKFLDRLRDLQTPVIAHSVDMSLGSADEFKQQHFERIKDVFHSLNCVAYSDHLCMTGSGGIEIGQLTTLPFTNAMVDVVCRNIDRVQQQITLPFIIENITNRFLHPHSELSEPAFINKVLQHSGCGLLLDLTNVYINSLNHGFDAYEWLQQLDLHRVVGIHLAGGITEGHFVYDTHSRAVHAPVWRMLEWLMHRASPNIVIVEWDQDTPTLNRLLKEVRKAQDILFGDKVQHRVNKRHLPSVEARP